MNRLFGLCLFLISQALLASPENRALLEQGIAIARKGDIAAAEVKFRLVLSREDNDEARYRLAQSLNLEEAGKLLEHSIKLVAAIHAPINTDDLRTRRPPVVELAHRFLYLSLVRWGLEDRTGALNALNRALYWYPDFKEAQYNRACLFVELGRGADADLIFQRLKR
ncbi:MAG: hypothetical protein K8S54_05305 [Spirochaetia bacterium]|nr:hypothetical protein [Spirochaetia bacterium]